MEIENQLITDFVERHSEDAFAALVRLHLKMVYSTALRQVGDAGMAEEICQNVFVALAQKAGSLHRERTVAGWLYKTTLNQARHLLRTEFRRRGREEVAAVLASAAREGESLIDAVKPLLDEALLNLAEKDRLAVLLHFNEEKTFREVGQALGVGEDAARKRVQRSLEWLVGWFRKRGFAVSAATLLPVLAPAQAAPALASSIAAAAVTAAPAGTSFISGFGIFMTTTKKIAFGAAALILAIAIGTPLLTRRQSAPNPSTSAPVPSRQTAPEIDSRKLRPRNAVTLPAGTLQPPPPPEKNFFERIMEGDMGLTMLPREQAEAFLARNRTNAQSLIGAYRVTHDLNYLRSAATNFPSDPAVILRVVGHDAFPENRRGWIDHFKQVDPNNSLPFYLSAAEHLKRNEFEAAVREMETAGQKNEFQDYVTEHMLTLEEMYLAAGHSAAEAKALGMSAPELPHLSQMAELSSSLVQQAKSYADSGDRQTADTITRLGLELATDFNAIQDGGNLLGEIVGAVMEQRFLKQLDPNARYPFIEGAIPERISAAETREKQIRADGQLFSKWIGQASEPEIISYFDRLKLYGESASIDWVKARLGPEAQNSASVTAPK